MFWNGALKPNILADDHVFLRMKMLLQFHAGVTDLRSAGSWSLSS
jgi:hypothetical protein